MPAFCPGAGKESRGLLKLKKLGIFVAMKAALCAEEVRMGMVGGTATARQDGDGGKGGKKVFHTMETCFAAVFHVVEKWRSVGLF